MSFLSSSRAVLENNEPQVASGHGLRMNLNWAIKISDVLKGETKIDKLEVRNKVIFGSLWKPA
jgi:hypothetical protein